MTVPLCSFSVLSKDNFTCAQEELGTEPVTVGFIDNCENVDHAGKVVPSKIKQKKC